MDSTRLPGKPLRRFAGRPLLDWLLDRAETAPDAVHRFILATSARAIDDPLADYARSRSLPFFRGSIEDVAGRIITCAEAYGLTHFFRINGDSPFVDPELFRLAVAEFVKEPVLEFVTNLHPRTYPYGVAVELFRVASYRHHYENFTELSHYEHVTQFFYENLDSFKWRNVERREPLNQLRLTVDTEEDAHFFEAMLAKAGDRWSGWAMHEIAAAYRALRPEPK